MHDLSQVVSPPIPVITIYRCTDAVSYQRRRDREANDRTNAGPVRVADAGPAAAGRTMKPSFAASEEVHVLL